MVYIGNNEHRGIFMRSLNNVVFRSLNAQFDEDYFSRCPDNKGKWLPLPLNPPSDNTNSDNSDDDYSGPSFDNNDDSTSHQSTYPHHPT